MSWAKQGGNNLFFKDANVRKRTKIIQVYTKNNQKIFFFVISIIKLTKKGNLLFFALPEKNEKNI